MNKDSVYVILEKGKLGKAFLVKLIGNFLSHLHKLPFNQSLKDFG